MRVFCLACALGALALRLAAQDVVISEFMAANTSTLQDADGDYSDWIELYNAGTSAVNLDGWYLTDDAAQLTRWRIPAVTIQPDKFLIVFASEKDRATPQAELHTSFKLSSAGEYLALVKPDGVTRAWEYVLPPPQLDDFSYGLEQNATFATLVASGAPARALIPTSGALGLTWTEPGFNDATWSSGATGVGYDRAPDYLPLIGINVGPQMDNVATSAYLRVAFTVPAGISYTSLRLRMKYDDGYVAYLNGDPISSRNAPEGVQWDSGATGNHDDALAIVFESSDLPTAAASLLPGTNVLAVHGLNNGAGSSDFLILPELDAFDSGTLNRSVRLFFHQPTPGSGNVAGYPGVSGVATLSRPGGIFNGSTSVSLTKSSPGGVIRYTLNGTEPTESSSLYTNPINLTSSTYLRARVIEDGLAPGPVASGVFLSIAADAQAFTSNLPVILLDNFGAGSIPGGIYQPVFLALFEPNGTGRTQLSDNPTLTTRAGIKTRGSSTGGQPKPNYALETWDDHNADKDYPVLGLPAESDWILHAPYNFDLAMVRNPLIYQLSNEVGRYAVRTRFVEVYTNTGGGSLAQADYAGVYVFMEKIKRGPERVDIESLAASYNTEPLVTGGYISKIDRLDPGDSGFAGGGQTLGHVFPKEEVVTPAQEAWISDYINDFVTALNGANYRNPTTGYNRYIDAPGWIDHHILNVLSKNVDALRLSTYMHKPRNGKLVMGPIWDFDRSMNSTDGRDDDPRTWNGTGDATDFFNYPWWQRLFTDVDFWQLWKDRWAELRQGPLLTAHVNQVVDSMADEIREAQVRNFQRWAILGGQTWQGDINRVKTWLSTRSTWIDSQFLTPPTLSSPGGAISPGFTVTLSAPAGTIYYTTDGKDPRAPGGTALPEALQASGPITLNTNSRVVARATTAANNWSAPAAGTFVVKTPRLVIAEIMYHPSDPSAGSGFDADDFEFLELVNADEEPLTLAGFRITGGVSFTFPATDTAPLLVGDRVVVVKNLVAFSQRYDSADIRIAGEYTGNLSNNPEALQVAGPLLEPILDFVYDDTWYPETDGTGASLVLVDPARPLATWGIKESWEPSDLLGGTPGTDGSEGPPPGRQIPGDSNQDGSLDIADAVSLALRLFGGLAGPLPCDGAGLAEGSNVLVFSVNGDGVVNLTDVIHLLNFLFRAGPGPTLGANCVRIPGCSSACGF